MVLVQMKFQHSVIKVHNWNMFQESLDAVEAEKARLRQENRENRAAQLPTLRFLPS
jgi:hypothetical protein